LEAWHDEWGLDQETSDRLAAWAGFDVVDVLEQSFSWDVFMENDGTTAAIADMLFEVGK
jgi:predicted NBD/HSP70 family sugar kinase